MFKENYIFLYKLSVAFQVILKYLNKWLLLVKKYIFQKGLILISNLYSIFIQWAQCGGNKGKKSIEQAYYDGC